MPTSIVFFLLSFGGLSWASGNSWLLMSNPLLFGNLFTLNLVGTYGVLATCRQAEQVQIPGRPKPDMN